ncbi:hypothetical protein ACSBR2_034478 [Camellia fascicularis]
MEEEMNLLEVTINKMEGNNLGLLLESGIEAIHRVDTIWWIEQIKLRIEPGWSNTAIPPLHSLQIASMRSIDQDHRRIRSLLPSIIADPLPSFPSVDSLKILIWNCRGTGNNTFRRNMRELLQTHKPGIIVLLETKVMFSSMGNIFSNMGFSAATIVDLVGRSGGIWLIWDTDQANVCASAVTNQYIQATVHKED